MLKLKLYEKIYCVCTIFCFLYWVFTNLALHHIVKKKQLGTLKVEKSRRDSVHKIEVFSNVNFRFFIKIALDYKLKCTYYDDELLRSSVTTYVNGKENSFLKTVKKGNYYEVTDDGDTSKYYNSIGLSGALSYFKEPANMSTIYSDFYGYDKNIEKIEDHIYKVTNPKNGQISEYFYKDGFLNKAIIHHFLMTFTMQLVEINDNI